MEERMERLQEYLAIIRTSAGWSAAQLGEKLGVSRQMISSLENRRNKMTVMQYRAIRNVFSEEIEASPEEDTKMMRDIIQILVDEPEKYTEEQKRQVIESANLLSPSVVAKKTTRSKASMAWVAAIAGVIVGTVAVGVKSYLDEKK